MSQDSTQELCKFCGEEEVFLEGLCKYCYEEELEDKFAEPQKEKEIIPKHGQSLKDNPELQRQRAIEKIAKNKNK